MPLIGCPACGRQISTEAEACPQCGHPNRAAERDPEPEPEVGPRCYRCSATATTKCVSCGALSCVRHLQNIYVSHGRGGAYELRCEACYSSAMAWKYIGGVIFVVCLLIFLIIVAGMGR